MQDRRLQNLQTLATIDLMPISQLPDFQNAMAGLKSCFALTEKEMQATATCPHCQFKPSSEAIAAPASSLLAAMDTQLEQLLTGWTQSLLT